MVSNYNKRLSNRDKAMSDIAYAQGLFEEAFPVKRYGSVKAAVYEAQRFISRRVDKEFTQRRARSIWEGTARRIDGEELDALRLAVIEESKREQHELRARLASLDAMLAAVDSDGGSETNTAIRAQASGLGRISSDLRSE